jgi:Zn-dependent peptidase ImmA (M78 family)
MTNQRSRKNRDTGPFLRNEFIPEKRIVRIALEQLTACRLLPDSPGPVAVEKFCDRKWGAPEDYQALESDVMGLTAFTYKGLDRIIINTTLEEDRSPTGRRRMRSTLAHEVGHAVLHEDLFVEKLIFERNQGELFGEMNRCASTAIVCRNTDIFGTPKRSQWWEIQANKFMAALLLPEPLFLQIVAPPLSTYDETKASPHDRVTRYYRTIDTLCDTFNVSREMACIAVDRFLSKPREDALL